MCWRFVKHGAGFFEWSPVEVFLRLQGYKKALLFTHCAAVVASKLAIWPGFFPRRYRARPNAVAFVSAWRLRGLLNQFADIALVFEEVDCFRWVGE